MEHFTSWIIIAIFSLFPLVIWGYGTTYLSVHLWNRERFLFGMFGGTLSVGTIFAFDHIIDLGDFSFLLIFLGVIISMSGITWILTTYGSLFIRGFLRKTLIVHASVFGVFLLIGLILDQLFEIPKIHFLFLSGLGGFLLGASLEEGVKHISTIGLTAKDFRFSRRDFLLFTFFITLGFVTIENFFYMKNAIPQGGFQVFLVGLSRLFFSLPIHIFAASICVMAWWKALSYRLLSIKYLLIFSTGYTIAIFIHSVYNLFLTENYLIPLFVLTGFGYFSFTQWLLDER